MSNRTRSTCSVANRCKASPPVCTWPAFSKPDKRSMYSTSASAATSSSSTTSARIMLVSRRPERWPEPRARYVVPGRPERPWAGTAAHRCSSHVLAAVDGVDLAGDEAGVGVGEELDDAGDLVGFAEAADGDFGD